jgi:hypothetical protein
LLKQRQWIGVGARVSKTNSSSSSSSNQKLSFTDAFALMRLDPTAAVAQLQAQASQAILTSFQPGQPFLCSSSPVDLAQDSCMDLVLQPPHVLEATFRAATALLPSDRKRNSLTHMNTDDKTDDTARRAMMDIMAVADGHDMERMGDAGGLGALSEDLALPMDITDDSDASEHDFKEVQESDRAAAQRDKVLSASHSVLMGLKNRSRTSNASVDEEPVNEREAHRQAVEQARLAAEAEARRQAVEQARLAEEAAREEAKRLETERNLNAGLYGTQRSHMITMGLTDDAKNLDMLTRYDGNMQAAVNAIFSGF